MEYIFLGHKFTHSPGLFEEEKSRNGLKLSASWLSPPSSGSASPVCLSVCLSLSARGVLGAVPCRVPHPDFVFRRTRGNGSCSASASRPPPHRTEPRRSHPCEKNDCLCRAAARHRQAWPLHIARRRTRASAWHAGVPVFPVSYTHLTLPTILLV